MSLLERVRFVPKADIEILIETTLAPLFFH